MNSKQLQYAVALAKVRNFSQAAQEFKISQPAFSKQIIALESELGVKLFDRNTMPLSLTSAGEFFIQKAKRLLFEEDNLIKTIEKYKIGEHGKLTIGIAPFRSLYVMPKVVATLKEKFPCLKIVLEEHGLADLQKGLLEGLYDFAIMNLPVDEAEFEVIPMEEDSIVLAVPNNLLRFVNIDKFGENTKEVDLTECKDLPFVVLGEAQELRKLFDRLCAKAQIEPNIFVEVTGVTTAREMVREGIAAALLPKQFLQREAENADITIFEVKQNEYVRQPAIVLRRGQYVSKYAEFTIQLLKEE
ncbi:MAG: LysR family transcriptional regulator [Clostridia bacterium]|nr:LysR family transcriptional regulator [Clostridia bacterium]